MIFTRKIYVIAILVLVYSSAASCRDRVLVTAKVSDSKFIGNDSYANKDGSGRVKPSIFKVIFQEISVKQGKLPDKVEKLIFNIRTHDDFPLRNAKRMFLVFDVIESEYKLLEWGFIDNLICINAELVDKKEVKKYFKLESEIKKNKFCRFVRS